MFDFKRKAGTFVSLSAVIMFILAFIGYIIFSNGAGKSYYSGVVVLLNILFILIPIAMGLFKYTEKYAPIALMLGSLFTLTTFVSKSYMYFTVIAYSGFDINMFFTYDAGYPLALIGYLVTFILSSVSMYLSQGENEFDVKPNGSKIQKGFHIASLSTEGLVHAATFVFAILLAALPILQENQSAITSALGEKTSIDITYKDGLDEPIEFFTSDKHSVREMKEFTGKVIKEAVEEGAVLLRNDNNCLPLAANSLVSFFSTSSVDLANGCGSSENNDPKATLKEGVEAAGLRVNADLWNWYVNNKGTYGRSFTSDKFTRIFTLNDANWGNISTPSKTNGDVAVMVITRDAGEGVDPTYYGGEPTTNKNGNYLELSANEKDVLNNLNATFDKVVVILNCANQVQVDFEADAILWIGNVGTTGAYGVGNLLAGKDSSGNPLSPSGHASDTFWKAHKYNPVLANFGATSYTDRVVPSLAEVNATCSKTTDAQILQSNHYTVYQEGIYNGYRYTETRYEDVVLNREDVGEYNYNDVVAYPFGYGESYTTFEYSNFNATKKEINEKTYYEVEVTVTNTGNFDAKDAVQIYLQKPYTTYDIQNHIEKASAELVGFVKTPVIKAGENYTAKTLINEQLFASYDAYGQQTYILDAGDYYLTAATDSHNAVNNILMAKGVDAAAQSRMVGAGNAALTKSFTYEQDFVKYSVDPETGKATINQFDNADMNRYEGKGSNTVNYVSRNNWNETVVLGVNLDGSKANNVTVFSGNETMRNDMKNPTIEADTVAYPNYGSTSTSYKLVDIATLNLAFDDPRWEDILDQLTWEDTVKLLSSGVRSTQAIDSVSKRGTLDYNGAIGPINYNYKGNGFTGLAARNDDPDQSTNPNSYVCNGLLAATFNEEFMDYYGKAMGEDCLWCGYNGLYGPGVNIHRSAFGGRSFEYYSEDPILSGKIASAQIRGIQSYGVYCYVKHAICNDAETMREGINIWANEQTIREIYLRPFELCIKEGKAPNVMSGFNRLGLKWNGHQGYLKKVLREEFGMEGFAVSDWYDERTWYMTSYYGLLNGNDIPDGSYSNSVNSTCMLDQYKFNHGELAWAMRDACHRMLYVISRSNVLNGLSTNTETFSIVPMWFRQVKRAKKAVDTVFGISLGLFIVVTSTYYLIHFLNLRKEPRNEK